MLKPKTPLAYLITFTCYGTRLHGCTAGSVDRHHNHRGSRFVVPDQALLEAQVSRMGQNSYELDRPRAETALSAMIEVTEHRNWELKAAHLKRKHVHLVVQACVDPGRIMGDMKSYASRALTAAGFEHSGRRRWTRGGSARYLWEAEDVENAVKYILHEQGKPMVVYSRAAESR